MRKTIKELRMNAGFVQEDMCRLLGIRLATYSRWEKMNKDIHYNHIKAVLETLEASGTNQKID